jgi:hypothetical protein
MRVASRVLFAVVFSIFSSSLPAADNDTGSGGTYAGCMNGCWKSYDYCKEHQSGEIDCAHQLGQCIEYCESTFDPQSGKLGGIVIKPLPPLKAKLATP